MEVFLSQGKATSMRINFLSRLLLLLLLLSLLLLVVVVVVVVVMVVLDPLFSIVIFQETLVNRVAEG